MKPDEFDEAMKQINETIKRIQDMQREAEEAERAKEQSRYRLIFNKCRVFLHL